MSGEERGRGSIEAVMEKRRIRRSRRRSKDEEQEMIESGDVRVYVRGKRKNEF